MKSIQRRIFPGVNPPDHHASREETAHFFCFHYPLDADRHCGGAVRNLVFLCAADHLAKGMFEDAEKFVGHFRFAPHERLQALDPFEIRNDHTSGVVGPLAASARMRHFNLSALLPLITRSTAAGTRTSQGMVSRPFGST